MLILSAFLTLSVSALASAIPVSGAKNMTFTTHHHQYGSNVLQSYDVFIPNTGAQDATHDTEEERRKKHWLVFIHGGYFHDLTVNSSAVVPSLEVLATPENQTFLASRVAGVASLNYRLSADPGVQDPATTPADELETARWPDHLHDVLAALRDLDQRYRVAEDSAGYVLSGHSVGAQMTFIAALQTVGEGAQDPPANSSCAAAAPGPPPPPPPVALLGVSGIYDFPQIHTTNPSYVNYTGNAMDARYFGPASPAEHPARAYERLGLRAVVLAHSHDDGLVPWDQVETMDALMKQVPGLDNYEIVTLEGAHNTIWSGGVQLAKAFRAVLEFL